MAKIKFRTDCSLDAVVIGRIAIDINPVEYFKPWAECDTFKKYVGGSAANIAVGLARLGKKVGYIGRISDDPMGDYCQTYMDQQGIDTSHIVRCTNGASMGLAFTEVTDMEHSRLIMYRNGAADLQFCADDVDEEYISRSRMLIVTGTALACSPSREAVLKALEYAGKHKLVVVFDIYFRNYTWKNLDEVSLYNSIAARYADVIMGSREEYDLMGRILHSKNRSDREIAEEWFARRAAIVVIKHGSAGSTAYTDDGNAYSIKPFPVQAQKGFGGGDGYGSAFLNGILEGKDVIDCLEQGSASAAMLVASHGCAPFMPTQEELTAFIKAEKEQYGDMVARS